MSHIRCPLCGKNAPVSSFNPSGLDLDLRATSFKGLGRGRGFAPAEEHSVLGDDEFSPQVADRALSLCRMFLDAGVLSSEDIMNKLGLDSKKTSTSATIPSRPQLPIVYMPMESDGVELARAREALDVQEKELAQERTIDRELLRFIVLYPYVQVNLDEVPWTIDITDVDIECRSLLFFLYGMLDIDTQRRLRKRLKIENPIVEALLESFTRMPRKSIAERLMEIDTDTVRTFLKS